MVCLGCERIAIAFKLNLTIAKDDDEEENDGTTSNENLSSSVIVKRYDNSHPQLRLSNATEYCFTSDLMFGSVNRS